MRVETKLFLYLFIFFVPVTLMYGFWSKWEEPIGVTALILTALLFALTGFYLWMTGKKLPLRPEDNASGEIEDAEGNYGYFVASSWTPLWLAGSGAIMRVLAQWTAPMPMRKIAKPSERPSTTFCVLAMPMPGKKKVASSGIAK